MEKKVVLNNRRKFERISCSLDVILEGLGEKIKGKSIDISERGIRLEVEKVPELNSRFALVFCSNNELMDTRVVVDLLWVNKMRNCGFFFTEISKENRLKIYNFIKNR
jgi:c-di-GMP-binding flagellar brake protein YcgR